MKNEEYELLSQLKQYDYSLYFNYLLIPAKHKKVKDAFLSINLLKSELHKSQNSSDEDMICYIRLQWWSDAINAIYDNDISKFKSPMVSLLSDINITEKIDKSYFLDLIEIYKDDVENKSLKEVGSTLYSLNKKNKIIFKLLFSLADIDSKSEESYITNIALCFSFNELIKNFHNLDYSSKENITKISKEVQSALNLLKKSKNITSKHIKSLLLFLPITKRNLLQLNKLNYDMNKFKIITIPKIQFAMCKQKIYKFSV